MKNRSLSLVLCLALLVTMLTGCTPAEKGFISLNKEMGNLKVFETTGKITVNFNKLPESLTNGKQPLEAEVVRAVLSNLQINFRSKSDIPNQLSQSSLYIINPSTAQEKELVTLIVKNNTFYINVRELINLADLLQQPELKTALEVGLGDADYISMTMEEYLTELTGGKLPGANLTPFGSGNITQQALKQQALFFDFIEGLMTQVFDNYELGMIKQEGNKYIFTLDTANVTKTIKPMLKYSLLNIEKLGVYLKTFLTKLTPQDFALLGMPSLESAEAIAAIDKMVEEGLLTREAMLQELENLDLNQMQSSSNPLQGSKMVLGLEKKDRAYVQDVDFNLVVNSPSDSLDLFIKSEQSTQECSSFTVNLPMNKIVSLTEFRRRLNQEMQVSIDNKTYTITDYNGMRSGKIAIKMNNGSTYLPMRQLAEALDEQVGWDATVSKAYVLKGGRKIFMTGLNINGTVYIKVRDFERLGYKVNWAAETRTAKIIKTLF